MKRALLVSPYFIPINLAGVHRARLLGRGLPQFGWEPIVLAVNAEDCEEQSEPALLELLPKGLRIESVQAWPARYCRPFGVGDVSLRGYFALRDRMRRLIENREVDLVFVTVLPGYGGMLGAWAREKYGLPFVLDYQDPWVSDWGATQPLLSKGGIAHRLAEWIEPGFVKRADAITAVSDGTLDTLRRRGLATESTPIRIVPIGSDPEDYTVAREHGRNAIPKEPGVLDIAYLGTVPERKLAALPIVFKSLARVNARTNGPRLRLHLIGTSGQADGTDHLNVGGIIRKCDAWDCVRLEPRRIGYLDALRTMQAADALQMLGSTERHYTGSKLFPYWLAGPPIISLGHAESPTQEMALRLGGVRSVTYRDESSIEQSGPELERVYSDLLTTGAAAFPRKNPEAFAPFSAIGVSEVFARLFDEVCAEQGPK